VKIRLIYLYLEIAFLCSISDVPPRQLSSLNLAASSGAIRVNFFCTDSSTRIVDKFVSMTTSNCNVNKGQLL